MIPGYVDFHCHLDLYPDLASAIGDAERAGVYTLTVTTTPKAWPRNYELTRQTRYVRAALGLHPQLVEERVDEFGLWERYLPQTRYVGEVGIDAGPRYYRSLALQKEIFERILRRCAKDGGKILTVHSVRAAKVVLDLIEQHLPRDRGRAVLHWFTGSKSEMCRAAEIGCYFSVNHLMLDSSKGRDLIASLPIDRLLTETDGPFTELGGRQTVPSDVGSTLVELGKLLAKSTRDINVTVQQNLRTLLS